MFEATSEATRKPETSRSGRWSTSLTRRLTAIHHPGDGAHCRKRLEAALGVPLIERDTAGHAGLTPAGRRFVQFAPQLVHAAHVAQAAATGTPVETLRLAVPSGVGVGVVAPLMPEALATLELALQHAHPDVGIQSVRTAFPELTPALLAEDVDVVLTFGPSPRADVTSTRLSEIHGVGLVGATHPLAFRRAVDVHEFARLPMIYSPALPDDYMLPLILADVRPLTEATLVPIDASNTAHVAQRILRGREVTVVPVALTANLPPELQRVGLTAFHPAGTTRSGAAAMTGQRC